MSELQFIETVVRRTARRRRWQRAFCGLWHGVFVGSLVWLAALGVYKVVPIPAVTLIWAGVALGLCALGGLLWAAWRDPSPASTARWLDQRLGLKERLSTALELAGTASPPEWRQLLLHDAATHAKQLDERRLLPFTLPRISRWALLVLALGVGLGFVPEYRSKTHLQKQADAAVIRETGKNLAELTRRGLEERKPALAATEKSLERVKDLGEQLAQAKLTRSEALRDLASVSEKLKQETRELAKDPALRRLEQAARSPGSAHSPSAADLQQKMEALQQSLGDKAANPEALDKLKADLQKLQQTAAGLKAGDSAASEALKQQLERSLADLARQAAELGLSLPPLDEALKALEASQVDKFLKDLNLAQTDLEKLAQMAKALQQLQMQMAELGKDLAEQLEKGQAFAAQATLKRMMTALRQASLSPEQLRQIMREVEKAIEPGSEYGKVGEFLRDAMNQMQQGNQPGAGQSLAKAVGELQRLMEQLGDAQALLAALENLDKASMCIGSCQGWGLCKAQGGFNPFGKRPGRGVGTWGEEGGDWQASGDWTEPFDASGVQRPDLDPRGITDRDQTLSDALTPTKLKGQFSPGGPLPSITLKGVSIKGTSKVQYEEAVTAAQADAQSALSQEKVPRAYQGAVKDYFDDLKK
ncbi:MAG TPA: hypothetical protein VI136_15970 [Verrucomicrobiae bacterium]